MYGSAALANYTVDKIWEQRTAGLLAATSTFLSPFTNATGVLFEAYCELEGTCNVDQLSMKAYLIRWMAGTSLLAPFTAPRVQEILRASAPGAAAACTAGGCGSKWFVNGSDGTSGLGQQLSALELFYALLADQASPPGSQASIQPQPHNITDILATATATASIPTPSASARPLFDGPKGGSSARSSTSSIFALGILQLVMLLI